MTKSKTKRVAITPQQVATLDQLIDKNGIICSRTDALKWIFMVFERAPMELKETYKLTLNSPIRAPQWLQRGAPLDTSEKESNNIRKGIDELDEKPKLKPLEFKDTIDRTKP